MNGRLKACILALLAAVLTVALQLLPSPARAGCIIGGGLICNNPQPPATCASALPNLLINLDASNSASVIRSGANVTAWNDLSGNGINFTGVNSPQYSATSWPGSLPSITFTNASSRYFTASTSLSSTTLSVFVVGRASASVNNGGWFSLLGVGGGDDYNQTWSMALSNGGSGPPFNTVRAFLTYSVTYSGSLNTIYTAGVVFDGTNGTTYRDFNTVSPSPSASTGTFGGAGTTRLAVGSRIGAGPAYNTFLTGDIAEVIVTTGAVTGTDLSNLHSCLSAKWGVP
jgi:hypothetical protein